MFVSEVQPLNAEPPILVILFGIVMLSSEEQPLNAELPMLVTLSEIITLVRLVIPLKAPQAIRRVPGVI